MKNVVGHLRRKSSPEILRKPARTNGQSSQHHAKAGQMLGSQSKTNRHQRSEYHDINFFTLPTELHAEILSTVSFDDLCAFRLVNVNACDVTSEGEIIRQWINRNISRRQLELHPPPIPPTFQYVLEQRRRFRAATELGAILAEYIEREILRYTLRRLDVFPDQSRVDVFETVKAQLRDKMIPLILTMQHYLENLGTILLSTSLGSEIHADHRFYERQVMESYGTEHVLLAHKFWMFICWLQNQIMNRPSYVGPVERTFRGWIMDPFNPVDLRLLLVFGNVRAFSYLMRLSSYKQRRKAVETWVRQLDPERNVHWEQSWEAIASSYRERPTEQQALTALNTSLTATQVWVDCARLVLAKQDLVLPEGDDSTVGTPWQTMDFLCEIAGYDVLHMPPPMMP